jgi:hypothetical protein
MKIPSRKAIRIPAKKELMMSMQEVGIHVFRVRGGEEASLLAYKRLTELLEMHEDLFASVYRAFNQSDTTWSLILMGKETVLMQYADPIAHVLAEAWVEPIEVPLESLTPFIERYLTRRKEMARDQQTFVKQHHVWERMHDAKQRGRRAKRKRKQ